MEIKVIIMSGAGNIFSAIDNSLYNISEDALPELSVKLCNSCHNRALNTDGLLVLSESEEQDFEVKFYNPDGSSGMMCGNGGRCAVKLAKVSNYLTDKEKNINMLMAGKVYSADINQQQINLYMPPAIASPDIEYLELANGHNLPYRYVNVNTDHIVIDYNDLGLKEDFEGFDIDSIAIPIRQNKRFEPNGTNVNFFFINNENKILIRTFERGVERETAACGTGNVATAYSLVMSGLAKFPVKLLPKSKEELTIDIIGDFPNEVESVALIGPAKIIEERFFHL